MCVPVAGGGGPDATVAGPEVSQRTAPPAGRALISAWRLHSSPEAAVMSWSGGTPDSADKSSSRLREAVTDRAATGLQRVGPA